MIGFRVHAHRFATKIWSQHHRRSHPASKFGEQDAQEAQIFRFLPKERQLMVGDTLNVHCEYDSHSNHTIHGGLDERRAEMCNQYLLVHQSVLIDCGPMLDFDVSVIGSEVPMEQGEGVGVAADVEGSVYFFHRGPNAFSSTSLIDQPTILKFHPMSRSMRAAFATRTFVVPHGLAIDSQNFLWATDVRQHLVVKMSSITGNIVLVLGSGKPGTGHDLNMPTDVFVHSESADIYVADGYGNSRIAVFSATGEFLREWGSFGTGKGQFNIPHSITMDNKGLVHVGDRQNQRVQAFDRRGSYRGQWGFSSIMGASGWAGHLSSVDYHSKLDAFVVIEGSIITIRNPTGCVLESLPYSYQWPHDAILTSDAFNHSHIFVAELTGKRLLQMELPSFGVNGL